MWQSSPPAFLPVPHVNRQPLGLLKGIDRAAEQLLDNTRRFAQGLPANNALLWGARGMGKSSLVKAAHAEVRTELKLGAAKDKPDLKLVEIHREDIDSLPAVPGAPARRRATASSCSATTSPSTRTTPPTSRSRPCWRAASRGGRDERGVLRHLQPPPPDAARHDGERALHRHQPVRGGGGEGVAVGPLRPVARLPQRHAGRIPRHGAGATPPTTSSRSRTTRSCAQALEWSITRGARSGRVAWQFIQDLAGRLGHRLEGG